MGKALILILPGLSFGKVLFIVAVTNMITSALNKVLNGFIISFTVIRILHCYFSIYIWILLLYFAQ